MIIASCEAPAYRTKFSDGVHESFSDVTAKDGGQSAGFAPHQLLEAALATCINITVRMYADRHEIPLRGVTTNTGITRPQPGEVLFSYEVAFEGDLTEEQKQKLARAAQACPVRRTLSQNLRFESVVRSRPRVDPPRRKAREMAA